MNKYKRNKIKQEKAKAKHTIRFFIDGFFTEGRKEPCMHCRNFALGGCSGGYCMLHNGFDHTSCSNHCKYYKRNSEVFTKDGKFKNKEVEKIFYM